MPATAPAPLFQDEQPLEMALELPLKSLLHERKQRPELDGVVVVAGPGGQVLRLDVKVSTRGHNRLDKCSFPPLGLDFKRSQVDGTVFAGQNKLKLVTLCQDRPGYDQNLELERLIYSMYQQVSPFSLRTRAVRVRYVDTDHGGEVREAPAFILEHFDSLAQRMGRTVQTVPPAQLGELDGPALDLLGLFQYLIGNTDWSTMAAAEGRDCCHNTVLLASAGGGGRIMPVPYDFDSSGLVDAPYAEPNETLRLRSVRDRKYRGYCASNGHVDQTVAILNAARPAMEATLGSGRLEPKYVEKARKYLADGFDVLNDPKKRQDRIIDDCRGD